MNETIIIAIISSSAFATLLSFCTQLIRDRMKNKHGVAAGVKIIMPRAFISCLQLESVTLPEGVTTSLRCTGSTTMS